jgi:hypothetical protein
MRLRLAEGAGAEVSAVAWETASRLHNADLRTHLRRDSV